MAFTRPTLQELIERIEADMVSRLELPGSLLRRSLAKVIARVIAGAAHLLHGHLEFISKQIFPDVSEAEFLDRQASIYGINRKAATFATGDLTFSGVDGTEIPEGTVLQRADGTQYETTDDGTVASGTATVPCTASLAGEDGNTDEGTEMSLTAPIEGITATATVASGGLDGGADEEEDEDLRTRLLERLQNPPQGGSATDYEQWALAVSGVTRAWVYSNYTGLGTVGVTFVLDDDESSIIPDSGKVTEVQDYIDARRPVTADVTVFAPIADTINFTISVTPNTTAVKAAVEEQLRDLIRRKGAPSSTIYLSEINEAVSLAEGEVDHEVTVPSGDVTVVSGHVPVMGTITWA